MFAELLDIRALPELKVKLEFAGRQVLVVPRVPLVLPVSLGSQSPVRKVGKVLLA